MLLKFVAVDRLLSQERGLFVPRRWVWLERWHLLSLDAPCVATVWVAFCSWMAGVKLFWADCVAMFLAVWILYVVDRLLDGRSLESPCPAAGLEDRHRFHHAHRFGFGSLVGVAGLLLVWVVYRLPGPEVHEYFVLALLLAGWLALVHARPVRSASDAHRLPKEVAVGFFFAAAVFLPTVARAPYLMGAVVPLAGAFGMLCTLNCLFLLAWERPAAQGEVHLTVRWAKRHLSAVVVFALLSFLVLQWVVLLSTPCLAHPEAVAVACTCSCLLLLALNVTRRSFARTTLRALADVVLLTPVVPVAWELLRQHHL